VPVFSWGQDAAEDPAVQRAPDRQAQPVGLDRRDDLALDVADGQVVDRLLVDQAEEMGCRAPLTGPIDKKRRADG